MNGMRCAGNEGKGRGVCEEEGSGVDTGVKSVSSMICKNNIELLVSQSTYRPPSQRLS